MLKRSIKYVDFNGNEQEDVLYFNLTEAEVVKLDLSIPGGLSGFADNMDARRDPQELVTLFERLLLGSYGEKSADGKYFDKSPEVTSKFKSSAAYSALFVQLLQSESYAADFFNQLVAPVVVQANVNNVGAGVGR